MKIVVVGSRGIPGIQGGVETHCEELYPRLVKMGCDVTLFRRSCYVPENDTTTEYKGIKLIDLKSSKSALGVAWYNFKSILRAKKLNADIVHIHAIGPAIFVPFARVLGLKTVVTHHGFDYSRPKWNGFAKRMLALGEYYSTLANELIVISNEINKFLARKYGRKNAHVIYNGVNIPKKTTASDYISSLGLEPQKYIFTLGRFVEEKGFDGLIDTFVSLKNKDIKLVIAGKEDYPSEYVDQLKQKAKENGIVLTGFVQGEKLNELFSHAKLFVLPSFHEGLPISLLEAMSYHLHILASDINANLELNLPKKCYFNTGNWDELAEKMEKELRNNQDSMYHLSSFNWDNIAKRTLKVYKKIK